MTANAEPNPVELEAIVAVVNGDVILSSELARRMNGQPDTDRAAALDEMVSELLVVQASETRVTVTAKEIDMAIAEIKKANNLSNEELVKALDEQGYTPIEYREEVRRQILGMRTINLEVRDRVVVGNEEVLDRYEVYKAGLSDGSPEPFAAVKDKLRADVFQEKIAKEKADWLAELRRHAYVEIRL